MPENNQSALREIDISELFDILKRHIIIIVLAAFIASGGSFIYTKLTYVPAYSSTSTLYLSRQLNYDTGNPGTVVSAGTIASELSLSSILVNDCNYILRMVSTMQEVIDELNLNTSPAALRSSISTNNPENTRVLEVSVVAASPELAKDIVDSVCRIGAEKISNTIGVNQINISEKGTLNYYPCNTPSNSKHIIVGIVAALAVYAIFFVISLFDDGIKSDSDVVNNLGLTVLGWIPDANATHSKRYGGYYRAMSPTTPTASNEAADYESDDE